MKTSLLPDSHSIHLRQQQLPPGNKITLTKKKKFEIEIWLELFLDVTLISRKGVAVAVLPVPEAHVWPSAGGPKRPPGV